MTAVGAAEDPPVVEPVLLTLPEFDLEDAHAESAPMIGPRHVLTLELGRRCIVFGLHLLAAGHRLGLLRHGRPDLRSTGAHGEVGVRVLGGGHLGDTADADLSFHVLPREVHGDAGVGPQLPALRGVVVGEEQQSALVEAFEQDDARARAPFVQGRDGHRIRFADMVGRLVVPLAQKVQGCGVRVFEDG